jgi:hypothetical protein
MFTIILSSAENMCTTDLSIRLNSVLQAVQFPARIANLAAGLANMYRDDFTLK